MEEYLDDDILYDEGIYLEKGEYEEDGVRHNEDLEEEEIEESLYLRNAQGFSSNLETLQAYLDAVNYDFQQNQIALDIYNEKIIEIQKNIVEEKIKLLDLEETQKEIKNIRKETNEIFEEIEQVSKKHKLSSRNISNQIDKLFKLNTKHLENVSKEPFKSNPVKTGVYNIVNLPIPEKFVDEMNSLMKKPDIYKYLDLRERILIENSKHYIDDILINTFIMDVRILFLDLRQQFSSVTSKISFEEMKKECDERIIKMILKYKGEEEVLFTENVSEEVKKFMKKLKTILERKIMTDKEVIDKSKELVEKYKDYPKKVEKYTKIINKPKLYTNRVYFVRKFTDEEIENDFKAGIPSVINNKYAKYQDRYLYTKLGLSPSSNNDFIEKVNINDDVKLLLKTEKYKKMFKRVSAPIDYYLKNGKVVDSGEISFMVPKVGNKKTKKETEIKDYKLTEKLENILCKLPKDILVNCASNISKKYKKSVTRKSFLPSEKEKAKIYIRKLYKNNIPVYKYSTVPESIEEYAESENVLADSFKLNRQQLELEWNLGTSFSAGDKVLINRLNRQIQQYLSKINNLETKQLKLRKNSPNNPNLINIQKEIKQLRKYLNNLTDDKISSSAPIYKGTIVNFLEQNGEKKVKVLLDSSNNIFTVNMNEISKIYTKRKSENVPSQFGILSLKPSNIKPIVNWLKKVYNKDVSFFKPQKEDWKNVENVGSSQYSSMYQKLYYKRLLKFYNSAIDKYDSATEEEKQNWGPIPNKGPLIYKYPPLPSFEDKEDDLNTGNYNPSDVAQYFSYIKKHPEENPYFTASIPVPNKLRERMTTNEYDSLEKALEKTKLNSFFRLTGGDAAVEFKKYVLDKIPGERLRNDLNKMFFAPWYYNEGKTSKDYTKVIYGTDVDGKVVPLIQDSDFESKIETIDSITPENLNENIQFINRNYTLLEQEEPSKFKIELYNPTTKTKKIEHVDYTNIKKWLKSNLEKYVPSKSSNVETIQEYGGEVIDPNYLQTLYWNPEINPTFQLIDIDESEGYLVILPNKKFRIKLADAYGNVYPGWTINGLYKYPFIVTEFNEYLKLLRESFVQKYNNTKEIEQLTKSKIMMDDVYLRKIKYITDFLKDGFDVKNNLIDYESITSAHYTNKIMNILEKNNQQTDDSVLYKIASEIEDSVRKSNKGEFIDNLETYKKQIGRVISELSKDKSVVEKFISNPINLKSHIIYISRTLPVLEKTTTNLINWEPDNYVLKYLEKKNKKAFKNMMGYFSMNYIIDDNLINIYEKTLEEKLPHLERKAMLLELLNLRKWENAVNSISEIFGHGKTKISVLQDKKYQIEKNQPIIPYKNRIKMRTNLENIMPEKYASDIESTIFNCSRDLYEYEKLVSKTNMKNLYEKNMKMGIVDPVSMVSFVLTVNGKNWGDVVNNNNHRVIKAIIGTSNSISLYKQLKKDKKDKKIDDLIQVDSYIVDNDGVIKTIDNSIVNLSKEQRKNNELFKIFQESYSPAVWNQFIAELENSLIRREFKNGIKNGMVEQGAQKLELRRIVDRIDKMKLVEMPYDQLANIVNYRAPLEMTRIPLSLARIGVQIYPIKERDIMLVGGSFPSDIRSYRYRDENGKMKTHLVDICKWLGTPPPEEIKYPENISLYSENTFSFEDNMKTCLDKLLNLGLFFKLNNDLTMKKEDVVKVCKRLGIYEREIYNASKYFETYGGDRARFPQGGTKLEWEAFAGDVLYDMCITRIVNFPPRKITKQKIVKKTNKTSSDKIGKFMDVSIIKSGNKKITRKIHFSKSGEYPVPIRYDNENFPVYSTTQKETLASMIESGAMSPWLPNKVQIIRTRNGIIFKGDVPFKIDERSIDEVRDRFTIVSKYYIEQTFRDSKYGMPFTVKIGIIPKKGLKTDKHFITKEQIPSETFVTNKEKVRIEYYQGKRASQSETIEMNTMEMQGDMKITKTDISKKGGYALLDSRTVKPTMGLKYDPQDVWSWNPKKDRKAGAQEDAKLWESEKQKKLAHVKKWLEISGSSGSAFIAAKNQATRELEFFRMKLPSQFKKALGVKTDKKRKSDLFLSKKELKKLIENPDYQRKTGMKAWKVALSLHNYKINYVQMLYKYNFIKIDDSIFNIKGKKYSLWEIIENPTTLFPNYNRSKLNVLENTQGTTNILSIPQYGKNVKLNKDDLEDRTWETISEILYNMTWTTNLNVPKQIEQYAKNPSLLDNFSEDELDDLDDLQESYPLVEIFHNLYTKNKNINLWNIMTEIIDTWYSDYTTPGPKLKYEFKEPIVINIVDLVSYLGDSYLQFYNYKKAEHFKPETNTETYLFPGCKYEKMNLELTGFFNEIGIGKQLENPYVSVFKTPSSEMHYKFFMVSDNLHKDKDITSNLSRRYALYNNLSEDDFTNMRSCFSLKNIHTKGNTRTHYAIDEQDVKKYFEKGGEQYSWYEYPDTELEYLEKSGKVKIGSTEFSKEKKKELVESYKRTLLKYYKVDKKDKFLTEISSQFPFRPSLEIDETGPDIMYRLNPITLKKLINKFDKVDKMSRKQQIENMKFNPEFLDVFWPKKKHENELAFKNKVGISMNKFTKNNKRILKINIPEVSKTYELEKSMRPFRPFYK